MDGDDKTASAMKLLERFIGEWRLDATFPDTSPVAIPPGISGVAVFAWELGGRFLVERSTVSHPDAPDGLTIVAPNPDGDGYTQHYFDSRGVARIYAMTFDGQVWTLTREAPDFTPLEFSQRFTGTFSADGNAIDGQWEIREQGSTWRLDFGLVYSRVE